jgi:hypothetical protein
MRTPTVHQIRTAIEVLERLGERLSTHAAHSVLQMPDTRLGDDYAARIGSSANEQISRIETVKSQLVNWSDEVRENRRQCVSNHV